MNVLEKLRSLMVEHRINENQLAKLSGVPQSTINSLFKKYNTPSIATLEQLCKAFDLTLSDFFYQIEASNESPFELAPPQKTDQDYQSIVTLAQSLNSTQKKLVTAMIRELLKL